MKLLLLFTFLNFFNFSETVGSDTVKIMTWNILEYNGQDTNIRNQYYRTVLSYSKPDVLVVQEMHTLGLAQGFLNVLNSSGAGVFQLGTFINGFDTDNAVYYKPALFQFISNIPIQTPLRDINDFRLKHSASGDTIRLITVHLKAGNTINDEQTRSREADSLRKYTNALPNGTNFLILGDYNMYRSEEPGYIKLRQVIAGNEGHGLDALQLTGQWNNSAYSQYHTQSTRVRTFGGGATGGLDDRFDFILYSKGANEPGGVRVLTNTITIVGNDGNHYNDSINKPPNNSVPQNIADALHYSSDHLPVHIKAIFGEITKVKYLSSLPVKYITIYNYPNPFNPETKIRFNIPEEGYYKMQIFDIQGKQIKELFNKRFNSGWYNINYSPDNIAAGIYFCELRNIKKNNKSVLKIIISK